jgi:hypothetical protein
MPRRTRPRAGVRVVAVQAPVADVRVARCKECPPGGTRRPAPHPGPRCATHHRARRAATRKAAGDRRRTLVYNISPEFYAALLFVQGGACAICQRARGVSKSLSVDHDHACCDGPTSCGNCVRGLLCSTCNKMLGHLRDDPEAFDRAVTYLRYWPSKLPSVRSAAGAARSGSAATPTTATSRTAERPAPGAGE